jgi:hypothetical protein
VVGRIAPSGVTTTPPGYLFALGGMESIEYRRRFGQ